MRIRVSMIIAGLSLLVGLSAWVVMVSPAAGRSGPLIAIGLSALFVVLTWLPAIVRGRRFPGLEQLGLTATFAIFVGLVIADGAIVYDGSLKSFLLIVGALCFAGAATAVLAACYYLLSATAHVKPERKILVHFVAPFAILLPQFWTDVGNAYRKRFLLSVLTFGIFFLFLMIVNDLCSRL